MSDNDKVSQAKYDARWSILLMSNYSLEEAREAEIRVTHEVMMEHLDIVLKYPNLFE